MTASTPDTRPTADRLVLAAALLSGLCAVVFGAIGAHGPLAPTDPVTQRQLDIATLFHLAHSLGLIGLALWPSSPRWRRGIALSWIGGIVLFAGSLYGLTLFATPWPGVLTPLGGLLLMLGWLTWLVAVLGADRRG